MSALAIEMPLPVLAVDSGSGSTRPCENYSCKSGEKAAWRAQTLDTVCGCDPVFYLCDPCRSWALGLIIDGQVVGCRKHRKRGRVVWTRI